MVPLAPGFFAAILLPLLLALARLDQLTDLLSALVADLLVELVPTLIAHRLSAFAADLLVKLVPALITHLLSALPTGLAAGHRPAPLLLSHRPLPFSPTPAHAGPSPPP